MKKQSRLAASQRRQMPGAFIDEAKNTGIPCRPTWSMARIFIISTQVMKRVDW
jgi:hypothetical protein